MPNNTAKISFIMPAYNGADTIEESIESIFNGNFENGDEVIIVNDASTDKTLDIVNNLQKKYPAIRIISHNINKGSAAAGRNTGIDNSKNELIFCLDADNILAPNTISLLKKFMFEKNADIAAFGELHFFKNDIKNITDKWIFKSGTIGLEDALAGRYWPGPSGNYLFTKECWKRAGRYEESLGGAYDSWAFGVKQLATKSKMVTMDHTFYYHRHGYESTFVRDESKIKSSLVGLSILIKFLPLIEEEDIDYIMSKEHRYSWFVDIKKRPIKIKSGLVGVDGKKLSNLLNDVTTPDVNYKKYFQPKKYIDYIKRKILR
jgi:glycosyltransferase involved in cell wall biosynthesis